MKSFNFDSIFDDRQFGGSDLNQLNLVKEMEAAAATTPFSYIRSQSESWSTAPSKWALQLRLQGAGVQALSMGITASTTGS
jgi:hypothetical protein